MIGQVLDYWIFNITRQNLYLLMFLQVIFCYRSHTWAAQLIRRYSIWISPSAASESSGSSYVFSGVFKPEQVDGVEDKGSRDTKTVDV